MNFTINIDHELKLIRYMHSGIVTAEDIHQAWMEFLSIREFTQQGYDLCSDYRKGTLLLQLEDVEEIVAFMRNIESVVRGKKQALIVDEPYFVAASTIFQEDVYREVGFNVQIFSTLEAALLWLKK